MNSVTRAQLSHNTLSIFLKNKLNWNLQLCLLRRYVWLLWFLSPFRAHFKMKTSSVWESSSGWKWCAGRSVLQARIVDIHCFMLDSPDHLHSVASVQGSTTQQFCDIDTFSAPLINLRASQESPLLNFCEEICKWTFEHVWYFSDLPCGLAETGRRRWSLCRWIHSRGTEKDFSAFSFWCYSAT